MTTGELWRTSWEWEPSVGVGCVLLAVVYLAVVRPLTPARTAAWLGGMALIGLTLLGPLDVLGDEYLFSAHMLEHLVFLVMAPPLLLLGLPPETAARIVSWGPASCVERLLRRPAVAWLVGVVTLYAWHLPVFYNAALADERVHIMQHLSFLVTATIFWWPVLAPLPDHRLSGHMAIGYLFFAAVANSVLGAVLTFSGPGSYPLYTRPTGDSPVLRLVRDGWGLDPAADQQLGGLFMWVVGGLFFLAAILGMFGRWYRDSGRPGVP
ncbi:MAG: cytochrome c oxidase assembly protein [Myxococcales bacterium]